MKITEARLKQIILEEVAKRLEEEDLDQLEEGWKERVAAALVGTTVAAAGGFLQQQVAARGEEVRDAITANVETAAEYQATDAGIISSMNDQLSNTLAYTWDHTADPWDAGALPITKKGAGVLPAEYSVMYQVLLDFQSGGGPTYTPDNITKASGDAEQNRINFFKDFDLKTDFDPARGGLGLQGTLYPSFDNIAEDYNLPLSDMSKSELYVQLWDKYVNQPLERVGN